MISLRTSLKRSTFRSNVRSFIPAPKSEGIPPLENPEVTLSRMERLKNYLKMVKHDYTEALKEIVDLQDKSKHLQQAKRERYVGQQV